MNNINTNKTLKDFKSETLDWGAIQIQLKDKLGKDIFESWLKKISFVEEFNNYLLLSVPTRFIRDWITSRYLDQILQTVKSIKKNIIRIEFKVADQSVDKEQKNENIKTLTNNENISFLKESYLQLIKHSHQHQQQCAV